MFASVRTLLPRRSGSRLPRATSATQATPSSCALPTRWTHGTPSRRPLGPSHRYVERVWINGGAPARGPSTVRPSLRREPREVAHDRFHPLDASRRAALRRPSHPDGSRDRIRTGGGVQDGCLSAPRRPPPRTTQTALYEQRDVDGRKWAPKDFCVRRQVVGKSTGTGRHYLESPRFRRSRGTESSKAHHARASSPTSGSALPNFPTTSSRKQPPANGSAAAAALPGVASA
jgi:hypothetical protein